MVCRFGFFLSRGAAVAGFALHLNLQTSAALQAFNYYLISVTHILSQINAVLVGIGTETARRFNGVVDARLKGQSYQTGFVDRSGHMYLDPRSQSRTGLRYYAQRIGVFQITGDQRPGNFLTRFLTYTVGKLLGGNIGFMRSVRTVKVIIQKPPGQHKTQYAQGKRHFAHQLAALAVIQCSGILTAVHTGFAAVEAVHLTAHRIPGQFGRGDQRIHQSFRAGHKAIDSLTLRSQIGISRRGFPAAAVFQTARRSRHLFQICRTVVFVKLAGRHHTALRGRHNSGLGCRCVIP